MSESIQWDDGTNPLFRVLIQFLNDATSSKFDTTLRKEKMLRYNSLEY